MGAGGQFDSGKFFHEVDETKRAERDDLFERILARLKTSGAEITEDAEYPLYKEAGSEEVEVGMERLVEFEMGNWEWRLRRSVEELKVVGRSVEELAQPWVEVRLQKKAFGSDRWEHVDLEALGG